MRILLLCFFLPLGNTLLATHFVGGEMSYRMVPNNNDTLYIVTCKLYQDCGNTSNTFPTIVQLCITNSCSNYLGTATLPKIPGIIPSTPPAMNGSEIYSSCNGPTICSNINSTLFGFREWWYEDTVAIPYPCANWKIHMDYCCRSGNSYNLGPNPANSYYFYLETIINNSVYTNNHSAVFQYDSVYNKLPIPMVEVNVPYIHTGGALDGDNDSLVFETIAPRHNGNSCSLSGTAVPVLSPLFNIADSVGNPFNSNHSYFLNKHTGYYTFVPGQLGYAVLAHKISEYRNGQFIGSVMRDVTVVCQPPTYTEFDTVHVCSGSSYTFPNLVTLNNLQTDTFMYNYFTGSQGCDSIILSLVDVVNFVDTMIQNGNILTSMEIDSTTTFQWINCTPFTVLTGDTTNTLIVTQSGDYAVIMSKYGCTDTSNCITMSVSASASQLSTNLMTLSPNPVHDLLYIDLSAPLSQHETIEAFDMLGRKRFRVSSDKHLRRYAIPVEELPNGSYMLKVGNEVKRFLKY